MNARLLILFCALPLLEPSFARAADAPRSAARLELVKGEGTEQCIAERALLRAVEFRLHRRAFRQDALATLYLRLAILRQSRGWSAEITVHDGSGVFLGRRSIETEAPHCSALDDSLALVVALLVDAPPAAPISADVGERPAAASNESATTDPTRASSGQVPSGTRSTATNQRSSIRLPRDTPAQREPWHFDLSAAATAAVGLLPGLAAGGELGLAGKAPRLPEVRLFAGVYAEREQQRAGLDSGARFHFAHVGLELCPWDYALGGAQWFGCAGQSLGRLRVAAFGFDKNTTTSRLTYAVVAQTGLRFPIAGALSGRVGVRAEVPLQRGIFSYGARDGSERELFETKPVTAVLDVGLIVRL